MSGDGSGRRLRQGWRVRMLRLGPVCRRLSEQDGSGRRAACHQRCLHDQRSHSPAAISRLRSGKRSRSSTRRAARCRRSLAGSGGRHRRSPEIGRTASDRRNAATRGGGLAYRATTAQWHAERAARRPKPAKLARNAALRTYVEERLAGDVMAPSGAPVPGPAVCWKGRRHGPRQDRRWANAWSPEQIARRLPVDFPDDETMRISHEAIYQALFVQGRGALRRELTACLRSGRALRTPRAIVSPAVV
jgi:hypothetical protein